ncbi:hypothetical protein NDU88_001924 [Pleurodeles waltl]|uniref:Uncharacterized protein n=1 Tax=Pleurodeles waltl TaxID=8319 RepID=A0AAV7V957_PLEWA|nr:hypothetical protein NDU88_001924 [Pleurodeles waltl]
MRRSAYAPQWKKSREESWETKRRYPAKALQWRKRREERWETKRRHLAKAPQRRKRWESEKDCREHQQGHRRKKTEREIGTKKLATFQEEHGPTSGIAAEYNKLQDKRRGKLRHAQHVVASGWTFCGIQGEDRQEQRL